MNIRLLVSLIVLTTVKLLVTPAALFDVEPINLF